MFFKKKDLHLESVSDFLYFRPKIKLISKKIHLKSVSNVWKFPDSMASDGYLMLGARDKDSKNWCSLKKRALISYFSYFSQNHSDL